MKNPVEEYTRLKEELQELEREAARAEGALKEIKDRLKKEFGVPTIKAGGRLLKQLEKDEGILTSKFQAALTKFKEEQLGRAD